ncbi:sulfur carrier protein ThiS [Alkalihalobacillus deserti]|uniref:sulfur carrier protein ThiS n=1 Tax=Alkalihalobacillus deserti TaxID=2879466 RepID=UPI001D136FBA|nr:sulfur carrier protein ThiS [Alkalihalobacillus deserti]
MRLVINGEEHEIEISNLTEVITHFGLDPDLVVTEVDGVIIERRSWEETKLNDGMKIELVQFVGGG